MGAGDNRDTYVQHGTADTCLVSHISHIIHSHGADKVTDPESGNKEMKRNVRKNALKTFVTRHVFAHSKAPKFIHVLTLELCQPQPEWTQSEGRVRL